MAAEMEEPISHVQGWVNGWIETAVVRSYARMIRGACLPSILQDRDLDWELCLGLRLAQ